MQRDALLINACGGPVSLKWVLDLLASVYRVHCHSQQARILTHYQLFDAHQVVVDDTLPLGSLVLKNIETGEEYGRLINLYVPH